jgi:integrase
MSKDGSVERPPPREQRAAVLLVKAAAPAIRAGECRGYAWDVLSSKGEHFTVTVRRKGKKRREVWR